MVANAKIAEEKIHITGIDLNTVFDNITGEKLVEILQGLVGNDELQTIKFSLQNTS